MHSFKFFQSLLVSQIFVFAKQVLAPGPYFLHPVLVPVFDQLEANFTFFAFKFKKKKNLLSWSSSSNENWNLEERKKAGEMQADTEFGALKAACFWLTIRL